MLIEAKTSYRISRLQLADEVLLGQGVYLVLLHAINVPPHLALLVNGKVFSLEVKGPTISMEMTSLLRLIHRKKVKSIFIKLSMPEIFTMEDLQQEVKKYFLSYPRIDNGIVTCLAPIKDFCTYVYQEDLQQVNFIFELLPKLEEQQVIDASFQLYLDEYLQEETFQLQRYSMEDVNESIRKANRGIII